MSVFSINQEPRVLDLYNINLSHEYGIIIKLKNNKTLENSNKKHFIGLILNINKVYTV